VGQLGADDIVDLSYIKNIPNDYNVSPKNILNVFDCNLKKDYRILIILGTNIPKTNGHEMTT